MQPAGIEQVLINLVINACDAMEQTPEPHLEISTRAAAGTVELAITDNGPGIPDALREKIFEPFFTTKPVGKGTGLGLAISYGIVERHGGRLTADSPAEGGARFTLALPLGR